MAGIFTRRSISEILTNESLTAEERADQVLSLYGKALDDGYIAKSAAAAARDEAVAAARAEWEKGAARPDPKESDAYKALAGEFSAYKAMQTARVSDEYRGVKPKFFETVYGMIDRGEGALPVAEQLEGIRRDWAEFFEGETRPAPLPSFGSSDRGGMPKGDAGAAAAFRSAWNFRERA